MQSDKLKNDYQLANCCNPDLDNTIVGYYSHNSLIKVHVKSCESLKSVEKERLISLEWADIIEPNDTFTPGAEYNDLDKVDFAILKHHLKYGIDYSLVVAKKLTIPKDVAFDRHKLLREIGLIERVEAKIVQYRKGIVDNKWIKHRNHTYFQLTDKGKKYLEYSLSSE